ncbi:hypothetical protein JOS77_30325 [Chromobacterium haemolyticum]|nr:hypothetical protein JOS77_30325 [Chromobacterium haemolyticum]
MKQARADAPPDGPLEAVFAAVTKEWEGVIVVFKQATVGAEAGAVHDALDRECPRFGVSGKTKRGPTSLKFF